MILINKEFQEGWNILRTTEISDVTINDTQHSLMIEGEKELDRSRSFFNFYDQVELLQKTARVVHPTVDDAIDEALLVGTTHWFKLKKNRCHLNIVDVRPLSDKSERNSSDTKGGE